MICEEATDQLGPFLDGELPSAVRDNLEAHLVTCSSCRAELEALREMTADMARPPTMRVPDALWTAIEQRLDSESRAPASRGFQPARMSAQAKACGSQSAVTFPGVHPAVTGQTAGHIFYTSRYP